MKKPLSSCCPLPREILIVIWSFDPTGRLEFNRTIHQINFIPVLQEIKFYSRLSFLHHHDWRKDVFDFRKAFRNPNWIVEMERRDNWKRFLTEFFLQKKRG